MDNLEYESAPSALGSKIGSARNSEEMNDLMLHELKKMKRNTP